MRDQASLRHRLLNDLKDAILNLLPEAGKINTQISTLSLVHKTQPNITAHCIAEPMAVLIIQGEKKLDIDGHEILCKSGDCMINCIEIPHSSTLLNVNPHNPFLAITFLLDKKIMSDLASEVPEQSCNGQRSLYPINVMPAAWEFLETASRLVNLLTTPDHIKVLAPLILRELHYLLLAGPQGKMLCELYLKNSRDNRIVEALAWLKAHSQTPVSIEMLARHVHMSVSSLHRHFKNVTGYSPLQYHKRLRLYEAQRLMLTENERADHAAMAVGYESITQFNREYKRMFGLPPHKDILKRKSIS